MTLPRLPAAARAALKLAVGAAILYGLLRSRALDPALLGRALSERRGYCALALAIYAGAVALATLRWLLLLRAAEVRVGAAGVFRLQMIGLFFNSVLPGGTGGDFAKGFYLFRENPDRRPAALASIAMDRLVGLYGLLSMGLIMAWANRALLAAHPILRWNALFYAGVFAAFTAAGALFLSPWAGRAAARAGSGRFPGARALAGLAAALAAYRRAPGTLAVTWAMTMAVHLGLISTYWACARALGAGVELGWKAHGFAVPTLTIINGLPISPAGLGLGEAAGQALYAWLGVSGGSAILALVHGCVLAASLCGAPFYFLHRARAGAPGAGKVAPG